MPRHPCEPSSRSVYFVCSESFVVLVFGLRGIVVSPKILFSLGQFDLHFLKDQVTAPFNPRDLTPQTIKAIAMQSGVDFT
jgi:hypothetical protein